MPHTWPRVSSWCTPRPVQAACTTNPGCGDTLDEEIKDKDLDMQHIVSNLIYMIF